MNFASLFAGKMLGDGYMNKSGNRLPRFSFIHTLTDKDYAEHCYQLFSNFVPYGTKGKREESYFDQRTQKTYHRIHCQSKTSLLLTELYPLWYHENRKTIPFELVANNLERQGLALWFQDDGSLKSSGNRIILSTESFTAEERSFLQELLRTKFNILAQIDNQNRLDISTRREVRKLQALVESLIHPSMCRKSTKHHWQTWQSQWLQSINSPQKIHRTSIYLPYDLYHVIRGAGYSQLLNNLLDKWLDEQWFNHILSADKRYHWILRYESIEKGTYLITPRFKNNVKTRLDLLSVATGFEKSELVTIAFMEKYF